MIKKEEALPGLIIEVGKKIMSGVGGSRDAVMLQLESGSVFNGTAEGKTGDQFIIRQKPKLHYGIKTLKISPLSQPEVNFFVYWCEARLSFNKV